MNKQKVFMNKKRRKSLLVQVQKVPCQKDGNHLKVCVLAVTLLLF